MNISATTCFFLECISRERSSILATRKSQYLHYASIDWNLLLETSCYHGLSSIVYQSLLREEHINVPPEVLSAFKLTYDHQHRLALKSFFVLSKLVDQLNTNDIQVISYKGPLLSIEAYGQLSARNYSDLDIIVHNDDYFKVEKVLGYFGYKKVSKLLSEVETDLEFREYYGEYSMVSPCNQVFIDVHSELLGAGNITLPFEFSDFWNYSRVLELYGKQFRTLSVQDTVLYLCLNSFKDNWVSMKSARDISGFLQNHCLEIDWGQIQSQSEKIKMERIVGLALIVCHELLSAPIPKHVLASFEKLPFVKMVSIEVCNNLLFSCERNYRRSPLIGAKMKFLLIYGTDRFYYLSGVIRRILKMMFAVNKVDEKIIYLPKRLHFLYMFIRLYRMMKNPRHLIECIVR